MSRISPPPFGAAEDMRHQLGTQGQNAGQSPRFEGERHMTDYKTSDLQLAAFLATLGHRVVGVAGPRERRLFVFDSVPEADVTAFYGGAGVARARDLFRTYRDLRSLVFRVA